MIPPVRTDLLSSFRVDAVGLRFVSLCKLITKTNPSINEYYSVEYKYSADTVVIRLSQILCQWNVCWCSQGT